MPKVVIAHDVADVDTWLKGSSERAEAIGSLGGANVVDHVALDGRSSVTITFETDDVDAMMAALAAPPPELIDAMERHGVVQPLTVYVERSTKPGAATGSMSQ